MADAKVVSPKKRAPKKLQFPWQSDVPKHPRNPYQVFSNKLKEEKTNSGQSYGMMEMTKICAAAWADVSNEDRQEYEKASARERLLYTWKCAEFRQKYPTLYKDDEKITKSETTTTTPDPDKKKSKKRSRHSVSESNEPEAKKTKKNDGSAKKVKVKK